MLYEDARWDAGSTMRNPKYFCGLSWLDKNNQQGGKEMATQSVEKQKMVNGVDVDQLLATIEAIKGASDIAKFQFRVRNKWINGGHNHVTIDEFYGAQQDHRHQDTI